MKESMADKELRETIIYANMLARAYLSEKLQKSLKESINIIQIENEERFQKEKLETKEDLELKKEKKNY